MTPPLRCAIRLARTRARGLGRRAPRRPAETSGGALDRLHEPHPAGTGRSARKANWGQAELRRGRTSPAWLGRPLFDAPRAAALKTTRDTKNVPGQDRQPFPLAREWNHSVWRAGSVEVRRPRNHDRYGTAQGQVAVLRESQAEGSPIFFRDANRRLGHVPPGIMDRHRARFPRSARRPFGAGKVR